MSQGNGKATVVNGAAGKPCPPSWVRIRGRWWLRVRTAGGPAIVKASRIAAVQTNVAGRANLLMDKADYGVCTLHDVDEILSAMQQGPPCWWKTPR